jgi:hypothetical protein
MDKKAIPVLQNGFQKYCIYEARSNSTEAGFSEISNNPRNVRRPL